MNQTPSALAGLKGIMILFGGFFILLAVSGFIGSVLGSFENSGRQTLLVTSAIQGVLAFWLPSWIAGKFMSDTPSGFLCLDKAPGWRALCGVVLVYLLGLPAINQIISWNEGMHLPESMSTLEQTLRQWEESNGSVAEKLLSTNTVGGLISGLLIIGLLTGFCEEVFFRGALQRMLGICGLSPVVSIWVAAFIFSAIHFQFFGFVPRLLLGAFFGFLLFRNLSLWTSVTAHALNNSIVVVSTWLNTRGIATFDAGSIGVTENGDFPVAALASTVAIALFMIFFNKYFFSPSKRGLNIDKKWQKGVQA